MCRPILLALWLLAWPTWAGVDVYVEQASGSAGIKYQCTAGEVVRAWALDVSVDQGQIVGVTDFFVGACTTSEQGYGLFPASFRDHITLGPGTNINWQVAEYTPLAVIVDRPGDTLPGLGSSGVTLEFGALWDPDVPATAPASSGTLCALQLSEGANVSLAANLARGGVASADPNMLLAPSFTGLFVQPPQILGIAASNAQVTVTFAGGELDTADDPNNDWTPTGNTSGTNTEATARKGFYRVSVP